MKICRITGSVHSTIQDPELDGGRILLAQPITLDGADDGLPLLAVDRVDAGEGDLVLVNKEGGGARIVLEKDGSPVQCVVVAVVDDIHLGGSRP